MNHLAICDVPALPILIKNAGIGYSSSELSHLGTKHRRPHPTPPTIRQLLSRKRLVSRAACTGLIEILTCEIREIGAHACAACTRIAEYNTIIPDFGSFIQHVSSLREHARSDVVECLSLASNFSQGFIENMVKKKTVPDFASRRVLTACQSNYADQALRWRLTTKILVPQECKPIAEASGRDSVSDTYMNYFCSPQQGCSGP
jgi:hypothetical protein